MFPLEHPPSLPSLEAFLNSAFLALYESLPTLDANILKGVEAAVSEKTGAFKGDGLLEQFDKNAIYNSESTWNFAQAVAEYVCHGEALFTDPAEAEMRMMLLRLRGKPAMEAHLAYVQHGCSGCAFHSTHVRYQNMHNNRVSQPPSLYREESELSYRWTLVTSQFADLLVKIAMQNPTVALTCSSTPVPAATEAIYAHVFQRTVLWWALNGPKK